MAEKPDGTGEATNAETGNAGGEAEKQSNPLDTFEFAPGVIGLEKAQKVYADSSAEGRRLHTENELLKQQLKDAQSAPQAPQGPPPVSPVDAELQRIEEEYGLPAQRMSAIIEAVARDVSRQELATQLEPVIKYGEADGAMATRYDDWQSVGQKAVAYVTNDPIASVAYNTLLQAGEPVAAKDLAYKTYKLANVSDQAATAQAGSAEELAAVKQRRTDSNLGPVGGGNRAAQGGTGQARSPGEPSREAIERARELAKNGQRGQNVDYDIAAQFSDILGFDATSE